MLKIGFRSPGFYKSLLIILSFLEIDAKRLRINQFSQLDFLSWRTQTNELFGLPGDLNQSSFSPSLTKVMSPFYVILVKTRIQRFPIQSSGRGTAGRAPTLKTQFFRNSRGCWIPSSQLNPSSILVYNPFMTIKVNGASENNLREIDAPFSDGLTVVTGLWARSGKSSLARCFNHPHPVPPSGRGDSIGDPVQY